MNFSESTTFFPKRLGERKTNKKVGDLIHAVRVAVTGTTVGPGLYDCLVILGREKSLERLRNALELCG